ncbi:MAG: VOC family protein [Gemmatimonadota bacterium]|nr:VOC family protein [Gemmatimonadota bacterium]
MTRLSDAAHVGAVRLQVGNLARSLEFYRGLLGFTLLSSDESRAALGAPGSRRALVELVEQQGAKPVRPHSRLGLYHFAVLVPDRPALGRALLHLHRNRVALGMADHLVSEALYLSDPDGLGIEIYRDRPREEWRREGGGVAMATDRLDVEGVAAAAAGAGWTEMPAGTVIGHVHLHVGELAAAEEFYSRAVGFDVVTRAYPGALFLSAGGYHHHLGVNTWARGAPTPAPDEAQLLHWELVAGDTAEVGSLRSRLESAAAAILPGGDDRGFTVRDPSGTAMRVVAR